MPVPESAKSQSATLPSWNAVEGTPLPLGATWLAEDNAYNFAVFGRHARAMRVLLYAADEFTTPCFSFDLDPLQHKSNDIWHCRISAADAGQAIAYCFQAEQADPILSGEGTLYPAGKQLLDPYARQIVLPPDFDRQQAIDPGPNAGQAFLGDLPPRLQQPFDWGTDKSPQHDGDLLIYEMHVRGLTRDPSAQVTEPNAGCYLGVIEKIPYLKDLGVTAVELMPVMQYELGTANYWGYMPLAFFSPHCAYASSAAKAVAEFRQMVIALHAAGIEVLLDVVFNHTAEAGNDGPCYGMKGLDNISYYMTRSFPPPAYADFSGTGNTLNCSNRAVSKMILDSLRYWVKEMHVDGFRFDLASVFSRDADGNILSGDPPIFAAIAADPDLANIRLIAEPWDAGGAYQLGRSFPGLSWLQWNGRFRDDIKRFVRSEPGLVATIMRRIYGSDDLFPEDLADAKHPYQSINYFTSHDGFTLYDTVAYDTRRNLANGANNTDGPSDDLSWNCGWEGDEGAPADVLELRAQQARNFCALLMLSNGTPMLRMGDEFLQTQQGNSNPWNQDNATTWLNWNRIEENRATFDFFRTMIAFRKHHFIARSRFWHDDIQWFGVTGAPDLSWNSHTIAYFLRSPQDESTDIYVMINAYWEPLTFTVQTPGPWSIALDTCLQPRNAQTAPLTSVQVRARSIVILTRTP
ncbi:glycogen debranching protein [Granulicella tundricola]|uniref:Alpha amylase catalytic region protein n=1 Tax=Granulicella tundricola (strain ATCC BAA-1859 / DSM 23138 / MP5ACTX9) TaxID=1198114 RepID=E8WVA4_GRATM|nr:alpha amylase catalytic region protein [Granulicella tundricola MP5ACTX9]